MFCALAALRTTAASYSARGALGTVKTAALSEASGLSASRRNPGVLWTHNDSGSIVFALSTTGALLSAYQINSVPEGDFEDMAIGPGPVPEVDYIYLGDIGDNLSSRSRIFVHRFPEPAVYADQVSSGYYTPAGVQTLTLFYPDGAADAETLMVDPVTGDLFIATKLLSSTRLYRASRAQLDAGGFILLTFVRELGFARPSAGDITLDGSVVALRREDTAMAWTRRAGQSIEDALGGTGTVIPVMGKAFEPNGEALGFHGTGQGYYTISEGINQPIFFFRRTDSGRPAEPVTLIRAGEAWRYRDLGTDEGVAWREPAFDDGAWSSGAAPLGYGQADEATEIGYGNPSARHRTTYFRKTFNVPPTAPLRNALLRLCFNDGVAVFLNGVEVLRRNLGPEAAFDVAASASNNSLQNCWHSFALNPALLLAGTNVIAVELHRFAADGHELTFDLQLLLGAIDVNSANYSPDALRPTVAFTAPASKAAVTNAVLTVRGTAKDNQAVARVLWAVGNGEFQSASGTNQWSAEVPLEVGTNLVRIMASDVRTNVSTVATRTFIRLPTSPLTVHQSGVGGVTPNLDGALLLVGRPYQLDARPASRNLFAGWSGSIVTNITRLQFIMQSNFVLQANFVTNPFVAAKGPYRGLVWDHGAPSFARSGAFTLNLTESGKFSGALRLGGSSVPWSGSFDYQGNAAKTVFFQRTNRLTVSLGLDSTSGTESITGSVAGVSWSAPLLGYRTSAFPKASPAPFAGRSTAVFQADTNAPGPAGHGIATIVVAASGSMTLAGTLADGTKATFKAPVSSGGLLPLYLTLYGNRGSLLGWLRFTNDSPFNLVGDCRWIKPSVATERRYPGGFTNMLVAQGSTYSASGMTNFLATNSSLCLMVAELSPDVQTNCLTPRPKYTFTGPSVSALKLDLPSGLWTGTYTNPTTLAPVPLKATMLLPALMGYGHVLTTNLSAPVTLQPGM